MTLKKSPFSARVATKNETMERVRFIQHQWRQILIIDFSYCTVQEALVTMDEARKIIRIQPEETLLILTDVTEGKYNMDVIESLKEFTAGNKPYVKASAVVGLDGLKKAIYNMVVIFSKRKIPVFSDVQEAKDWLILQ